MQLLTKFEFMKKKKKKPMYKVLALLLSSQPWDEAILALVHVLQLALLAVLLSAVSLEVTEPSPAIVAAALVSLNSATPALDDLAWPRWDSKAAYNRPISSRRYYAY